MTLRYLPMRRPKENERRRAHGEWDVSYDFSSLFFVLPSTSLYRFRSNLCGWCGLWEMLIGNAPTKFFLFFFSISNLNNKTTTQRLLY